jgi:hypothetical protein
MCPSAKCKLAEKPRRHQQQRQNLLRFVPQQNPTRHCRNRPQQNRARPVLLNVEDLPYQRNGRARGHRAHGVQRGREAVIVFARPGAGQVKDGHHRDDQQIARAGANLVPMRRDKQHHAAGQQNGSQNERHNALPAQPRRVRLFRLKSANAARSIRIQDAGLLPAV